MFSAIVNKPAKSVGLLMVREHFNHTMTIKTILTLNEPKGSRLWDLNFSLSPLYQVFKPNKSSKIIYSFTGSYILYSQKNVIIVTLYHYDIKQKDFAFLNTSQSKRSSETRTHNLIVISSMFSLNYSKLHGFEHKNLGTSHLIRSPTNND